MKKLSAILLVLAMVLSLAACAAREPAPEPTVVPTAAPTQPAVAEPQEPAVTPDPNRVGLSYWSASPAKLLQPDYLSGALENAGFQCEVRVADEDMDLQEQQIREMVADGVGTLIIGSSYLDAEDDFLNMLSEVMAAGVTVIINHSALYAAPCDYYFAWDVSQNGIQCARWIEDALDLPNAGDKTYHIEFFFGDRGSDPAWANYRSAMLILKPYLDAGTLVCRSGQVDWSEYGMPYEPDGSARERMTGILNDYYREEPLDVILTDCCDSVDEILAALESDYNGGHRPLIATTYGVDGDVERLIRGKTDMCAIGSFDDLQDAVVELCLAIARGEKPAWPGQVSGYDWNDLDHTILGTPRVCTAENAEETLLEFGYYSQEELDRFRSGEDAQ